MKRCLARSRCLAVLFFVGVALAAGGWTLLAGTAPFGASLAHLPKSHEGAESTEPLFCAPGLTEPASRVVSLAPPRPGRLVEVLVGPGDAVTGGGVLAVLEHGAQDAAVRAREAEVERARAILARLESGPRPVAIDGAKARARAAEGELIAALAALELATSGPRDEEIAAARSSLAEAEAKVEEARWTLERNRRAVPDGAMPEQRLTEAETALAVTRARADRAKSALELLLEGTRHEEIARLEGLAIAARGRKDEAQAEVRRLEEGTRAEEIAEAAYALAAALARFAEAVHFRDEAFLRSPLDGVVVYRHRHPGEQVSSEDRLPVLEVATPYPLRVRAEVDEFDVAKVHAGQAVYATAPAFGERRFAGRVVYLERTLGRKSFQSEHPREKKDVKILEVVVELDRTAEGIPLGMPLRVWFLSHERSAVSH